jgi:hypothetical protein
MIIGVAKGVDESDPFQIVQRVNPFSIGREAISFTFGL